MKKIIIAGTLLGACVAFANPYAAAKCTTCHGMNGEKSAMSGTVIKDMSKADFLAAMKGYKAGTYAKNPGKKVMMENAVKPLGDADFEAIANQLGLK